MEFLNLTQDQWVQIGISAGVVIIVAAIARRILNLVLDSIIARITGRTKTQLDDTVIEAIRGPLYWFVVILTAQAMATRLAFLPDAWDLTIADIEFVLYFLVVFVLTWQLVSGLFQWYAEEMTSRAEDPKLARSLVDFFDKVALVVIGTIGLIVLLSHFGANITGLVTTLGVGSLAVALAAQAAFEDTINGFVILIDQPFRVGHRIEILDLATWGDVMDIGLRSSRIRTRDNRMVIVPNSVLGNSLVVNYSYPDSEYRISTPVGVGYGVDIEQARQVMIEAVSSVDGVLLDQPIQALFLEFGDNALVFQVRWWIQSYVDTRAMYDAVNTAVYNALNEAKIEIPFPQRDVWHRFSEPELEKLAKALKDS